MCRLGPTVDKKVPGVIKEEGALPRNAAGKVDIPSLRAEGIHVGSSVDGPVGNRLLRTSAPRPTYTTCCVTLDSTRGFSVEPILVRFSTSMVGMGGWVSTERDLWPLLRHFCVRYGAGAGTPSTLSRLSQYSTRV